jgi:hypothetical protein
MKTTSPQHATSAPQPIQDWHAYAKSRNVSALADLLDEHCTFQSPVVFTPQQGRAITTKYLAAAMQVLGNESFVYKREWYAAGSAVLEFESSVEGVLVNGVDIITWNAAHKITDFKVMVRPLKGVNKLHEVMGRMLAQISPKP